MRVQRLICLGQIIKNEAYQSFFCHCHLDRYRVACPLIAGRFRAGDSLEFFVLALMKREYDARQEKARQRRWKRAHFPLHKSELKEARDGCQLRRLEKGIAANDLLLIDELSYARFNQEESEQLFKVISERSREQHDHHDESRVFQLDGDVASDMLVAALVDCLTAHSHVLNMNGESYRLSSGQKHQHSSQMAQ